MAKYVETLRDIATAFQLKYETLQSVRDMLVDIKETVSAAELERNISHFEKLEKSVRGFATGKLYSDNLSLHQRKRLLKLIQHKTGDAPPTLSGLEQKSVHHQGRRGRHIVPTQTIQDQDPTLGAVDNVRGNTSEPHATNADGSTAIGSGSSSSSSSSSDSVATASFSSANSAIGVAEMKSGKATLKKRKFGMLSVDDPLLPIILRLVDDLRRPVMSSTFNTYVSNYFESVSEFMEMNANKYYDIVSDVQNCLQKHGWDCTISAEAAARTTSTGSTFTLFGGRGFQSPIDGKKLANEVHAILTSYVNDHTAV